MLQIDFGFEKVKPNTMQCNIKTFKQKKILKMMSCTVRCILLSETLVVYKNKFFFNF